MLYEKSWVCNYDELISYYPLFYQEVREMVAILQAHGKLADDLEESIEQVFANNFIDTADAATIERLEKFLDINLNRSRSLEERRRLVKAFFAGFGKVSATVLKEIIQTYTEADVSARFEPCDEAGNNMLYLEFERGSAPTLYMSDINLLLSKKIPAHIKWQAALVYPFPIGIGVKRKHYKIGYDLTGTKPDLAMVGLARMLTSVAETHKSNHLAWQKQVSENAKAGQVPDISSIGSYLAIRGVIESGVKFYTTDIETAQNGDLECCGQRPDLANIGKNMTTEVLAKATSESHVSMYEATGTKPDPTSIGKSQNTKILAEATSESHINAYEAAGTKPDMASIGAASEIGAKTEITSTEYSVNYIYCGTQYTQS